MPLNSMPLKHGELDNFVLLMDQKLTENSHKSGWKKYDRDTRTWKTLDNDFLITKLLEETAELIWSINSAKGTGLYFDGLVDCFRQELIEVSQKNLKGKPKLEAADVANISMMLGDNNGGNF